MNKKTLSFHVFYNEFIKSKTVYKVRQSINQIFYGSVSSEKISQSLASKIRTEDYVFTPGLSIFQDYIIFEKYSIEDKANFIKKLNLSDLPRTGEDLCERLKDYYLSDEIYYQLMDESDIYVAMVKLLEHIMHAKDLTPKMSEKHSAVIKYNRENKDISYVTELMEAMRLGGEDIQLDSLKEPLGWYIRLITSHTKVSSSDIARRAHLAHVTFCRKTNPNVKNKRHLYLSDIQEICRAMDTSLGSILYCYENREILENCPETIEGLCLIGSECDVLSRTKKHIINEGLLTNSAESVFKKWFGRYFCYFSSTNSRETNSEKKEFAGRNCSDDEYKELAELFTDDHIYSGILTIGPSDSLYGQVCTAHFRFMVDPEQPIIKEYFGTVTASKSKQALFIELYSEKEEEIAFLIIEDTNDVKVRCAIASVLIISSRENHRKPCSERMIISEERIYPGTQSYQIVKANLKMHDRYIRIDTFGFGEVIRELMESGDPKSIEIARKYDKLEKLGPENSVVRNELAYIKDTYISNLTDLSEEQKLIFESSLRLHSIAPWYSKSNSKKIKYLIELIREQMH